MPEEESLALETYRTWLRLFELQRYYSWVIDRFHLSTRAYQIRAHGRDYDFRWLEDGLAALGFHLGLCVRSPETLEAARAERLHVSGNPSQYDDLEVFVQEQELFRRLAGESLLPSREIDVSDDHVARAVESIGDWLSETGGLWACD